MLVRVTLFYPNLKIKLVQIRYEDKQEFLRNYKIDLIITGDVNKADDIISEKIFTDHLSIVVPEIH